MTRKGLQRHEPPIYQRPYRRGWVSAQHEAPGDIYLIINIWRRKVKLGLSNNPERRIKELRTVYGSHLFIFWTVKTINMAQLEDLAHRHFHPYNAPEPEHLNGHSEWFWLNPVRLIKMMWFLWTEANKQKIHQKLKTTWQVVTFKLK